MFVRSSCVFLYIFSVLLSLMGKHGANFRLRCGFVAGSTTCKNLWREPHPVTPSNDYNLSTWRKLPPLGVCCGYLDHVVRCERSEDVTNRRRQLLPPPIERLFCVTIDFLLLFALKRRSESPDQRLESFTPNVLLVICILDLIFRTKMATQRVYHTF